MKSNTTRTFCLGLVGTIVLTLVLAGPTGAAQYAVTDLGRLDTDPNYPAVPLWVNNSGVVVGAAPVKITYIIFTYHIPYAFVWKNGTLSNLGLLPGSGSYGGSGSRCVNDANYVVGLNYGTPAALGGDTLHNHAFLWPDTGTMTDLGSMTADANDTSGAFAINNGGHVVGTWSVRGEPNVPHAFLRWSNGVVTQLGTFGGNTAAAWDINDSNQVVGRASTPDGAGHAFLWQNGVMSNLGALPGYDSASTALAINSSGQVVGSSSDPNDLTHAFLYANGVMTDLGTLPGRISAVATDINNRGLVVGSSSDPNGVATAFLWKNGVMYDLNSAINPSSGWVLKSVQSINNIGQIAGSGTQSGVPKGFLMRVYFLEVTVNDPNRGSVGVNPNQVFFDPNTSATLTANANPGAAFDHWSGDASGSTNPTTIVMNGCKTVTANFTELRYTLTLTANPSGGGTINAVPPPGGDGKYAYGTVVTLTANAATGYGFNNWSGDASGSSNPVQVTMNGNKSVTANFTELRYTLTLSANPPGGGSIDAVPPPEGDGKYPYGTVVTLTAHAATGYVFGSWSGDASGSSNPVQVTMTANRSVTANFTQLRYTLTLAVNPIGTGSINANPLPGGDGKYAYGTAVTLTANPATGYLFSSWSGDASGPNNPTQVTMDGNKNVTADFVHGYTLTLFVYHDNWGTVSVEPNLPMYPQGTAVTLTAVPNSGKSFLGWTIDDTNYPTDDPRYSNPVDPNTLADPLVLPLTMNSNMQVESDFKCGSSAGSMLPLGLVGLLAVGLMRRKS
jgi:uncharacterized repeat protein (TIGR02543 family)